MQENKVQRNLIHQNLRWRCIGPSRGGRVVAVAGDPANQQVFYFGAAAGTDRNRRVWFCLSGGKERFAQ